MSGLGYPRPEDLVGALHDRADPTPRTWKPGDRVRVFLPDSRLPHRRGRLFFGTVREVDPPGLRSGVRVDLDEPVNGLQDCFATHAELVPMEAGT